MKRLIEYTVFSGLVTACRFATCPTRRSSVFVIATTDGVVRPPSWLGITTGSPPCITATTELVVPRSIPMILLITTCPPSIQFCAPALTHRETRPIQLGSLVPSSARTGVYRLSVSLSSFLIMAATCLFSWPSIAQPAFPIGSSFFLTLDNSFNIISFRNQGWTYKVALLARRKRISLHPCKPFRINTYKKHGGRYNGSTGQQNQTLE